MSARELITEHLDLWTGAVTKKSSRGRGSNGKVELTGVKKLREFILELAFRGKLTEQQLTDEPALTFLERSKTERKALGEKSALRKKSATPPVNYQPFTIPSAWSWARLGDIGLVASSRRVRQRDWQDHGVPFYRAREIVKLSRQGHVENELFISETLFSELAQNGHVPEADDLMLTGVGTIGVPYIVKPDDRFYFKDASVLIFKNIFGINPQFLYYFYHSPFWKKSIHKDSMGTTVHTLTIVRANLAPIPIPPIVEQHRIVQKVDELMDLCDRLEQQTSDQLEAHETLVDTLLGTLTLSENATELADNWARLATHFDTLFTTEQSIDKLKQTILQLAVMGRLVEQDAGDKPAAILLSAIHQRKTALSKSGKLKKPQALTKIDESQRSYPAASHWEWATFQNVADEISTGPFGSMIHKHDYVDNGTPLINPSHMVNGHIKEDSSVSVSPSKAKELSSYRLTEGDIVMARRGEVGRCAIVSDREAGWLCGTGSFVLRFHPDIDRQFILLLFATDTVREYLTANSVGTTMTNLNHSILKKMPVALPSADEQHRIVGKADELMALCDQLKERLNQASETRFQLSEMVVQQSLY